MSVRESRSQHRSSLNTTDTHTQERDGWDEWQRERRGSVRGHLSPCACVHLCEAALERHIHREADPHHVRDVTGQSLHCRAVTAPQRHQEIICTSSSTQRGESSALLRTMPGVDRGRHAGGERRTVLANFSNNGQQRQHSSDMQRKHAQARIQAHHPSFQPHRRTHHGVGMA